MSRRNGVALALICIGAMVLAFPSFAQVSGKAKPAIGPERETLAIESSGPFEPLDTAAVIELLKTQIDISGLT